MHRNVFVNFFYRLACKYPTPSNLSYLWNFGIFALVALIIQIITGIILVMHYTPHIDYSFYSVEHIMRDVNYGWLLRYAHANGASMFFIVVYAHIFRGMLYGSYLVAREALWCSGVLILLFMILTAFLGYILPWGQMSLWGATVITNLASTLPKVGEILVFWLWGGFSVANPTLTKFFSLHYIFPFIILIFVIGHLLLLHLTGSSNPLGINYYVDKTPFAPYYIIKDTLSIHWFLIFYSVLIFFIPNYLGHPDNYIPANSDVTPEHIVPEWYFLPFYAILRSIPDKSLGVIALLLSIIFLFFLPFLHKSFLRSSFMKPIYRVILLLFFSIAILLGYIGSKPIEYPYLIIGQLLTLGYFSFFALVTIIDKLDFRLVRQCIQGNFTKELKKNFSFIILAMPLISASDMLVNFSRISLILAIIYASVNLLSSFAFKIALFQKIKKNKFFIDLTSLMVLISRIFVHLSTKKANTISRCSGIFLANFIFIRAAVGSGLLPLGLNFFTFLIFSFYLVSMINTFFRVSVFFGHRMDSMEKSINLFRNPEDWNRVFKYGWRIGKPYLNQANVNKPFQQNSQNVDGLKRFGIYGAIAGTGVAAYAAYEIHETRIETRKTRIATEESVRIQKQVADAQERSIDISEREKGYMSQAHFEQKWNPFGEKRK